MHKYNEIPQTALEKFEEQVENLRAEVADKEDTESQNLLTAIMEMERSIEKHKKDDNYSMAKWITNHQTKKCYINLTIAQRAKLGRLLNDKEAIFAAASTGRPVAHSLAGFTAQAAAKVVSNIKDRVSTPNNKKQNKR